MNPCDASVRFGKQVKCLKTDSTKGWTASSDTYILSLELKTGRDTGLKAREEDEKLQCQSHSRSYLKKTLH